MRTVERRKGMTAFMALILAAFAEPGANHGSI